MHSLGAYAGVSAERSAEEPTPAARKTLGKKANIQRSRSAKTVRLDHGRHRSRSHDRVLRRHTSDSFFGKSAFGQATESSSSNFAAAEGNELSPLTGAAAMSPSTSLPGAKSGISIGIRAAAARSALRRMSVDDMMPARGGASRRVSAPADHAEASPMWSASSDNAGSSDSSDSVSSTDEFEHRHIHRRVSRGSHGSGGSASRRSTASHRSRSSSRARAIPPVTGTRSRSGSGSVSAASGGGGLDEADVLFGESSAVPPARTLRALPSGSEGHVGARETNVSAAANEIDVDASGAHHTEGSGTSAVARATLSKLMHKRPVSLNLAAAGFSQQCTPRIHPNEDRYVINMRLNVLAGTSEPVALLAVADGHGGSQTSEFIVGNLARILAAQPDFGSDYSACLTSGFHELDARLKNSHTAKESGACLCCCLVTPTHLYVASAGDCRLVLYNNTAEGDPSFPVTNDHKATEPTEMKRIQDCGGFVVRGRVFGMLAVSRAIGDFEFKNCDGDGVDYVIATPDVFTIDRRDFRGLTGIALASDGIWDVLSNSAVFNILAGAGLHRIDPTLANAPSRRTSAGSSGARSGSSREQVEEQLRGFARQVVDAAVANRSRDDCTFIAAAIVADGSSDDECEP